MFHGQCSFSHIFNDYAPRDNATRIEYGYILDSWLEAILVAREHGIQVDLVPVVLNTDETSINASIYKQFTTAKKPVPVYEYLRVISHDIHLPTIGEVLDAGMNASSGAAIVFTNRDIGMYPNFYLDACHDLSQPGVLVVERTRARIAFDDYKANKTKAMFTTKLRSHPGADCFIIPRHGRMVLPW